MKISKNKERKISPGSHFQAVRTAHAQELAEDYVEVIADLIDHRGEARTTEIAKQLGVSHSTVNTNLGRLELKGFVLTEKYRATQLTDLGRRLASATKKRHEVIRGFLMALNLPTHIIESDSEGLEHHLSPETVIALQDLTMKLRKKKP